VTGGAATFTAVLLAGPLLVPRLIRIIGAPLGRTGRLATRNAVRDPRRTAVTTASLLVGVTLATAVLTGMTTWRSALDDHIARDHPIDVALTSSAAPLPADLLTQVRRTPGVAHAIPVHGTVGHVTGLNTPIPLLAAPAAAQVARDGGTFAQVRPGTIKLDSEAFGRDFPLRPGDQITATIGDRHTRLRVTLGTGWGPAALIAPETLAALTKAPAPHAIWIRATPDADPAHLATDLHDLAAPADATIENGLRVWESLNQ